jgi:hypothetical protein
MPLRFQGAASVSTPQPRRLLEFRVRLHSQRCDPNNLFRPAVLDVFELFASAKVRFRSHLCIIGRFGQQRDVVLLDEAEPHAVAVQPTLLAQGDSGACGASEVTLIAERSMEPLWSPAVATSGKRWQMHRRRKPRKQAKSFAAGSYQLPANLHGKGGGRRFESVRGLRVFACSHDLALLEHGLMMPAMLVPMLFRLAGHAGHDGHGKR